MTANGTHAVAMLIAQLTFRGMPLVQGMTLTQLIRLHELQHSEINSLLKAAMDLPIATLPEKQIRLGKHTFPSVGEMAGHLIAFGLSQKLGVEKIGMLTCIAGWVFSAELEPQQTVGIRVMQSSQQFLKRISQRAEERQGDGCCISPDPEHPAILNRKTSAG